MITQSWVLTKKAIQPKKNSSKTRSQKVIIQNLIDKVVGEGSKYIKNQWMKNSKDVPIATRITKESYFCNGTAMIGCSLCKIAGPGPRNCPPYFFPLSLQTTLKANYDYNGYAFCLWHTRKCNIGRQRTYGNVRSRLFWTQSLYKIRNCCAL